LLQHKRYWCATLTAWVHRRRLCPWKHIAADVVGEDAAVLATSADILLLGKNLLESVLLCCTVLAEIMFNLVLCSGFFCCYLMILSKV
jgi:hypothetical protein